MEELPEDIHDYIVSYISDLEDLLTIPRINKQFKQIANRYRHPLMVSDKEWTDSKWIYVMHSISNIYQNINEIHIKRCNITEQALSGLLLRPLKIINLRECRQITNHLNWLNNLNKIKCYTLALAKCSKLPEFSNIITYNTTDTSNAAVSNLNTLLLDRQSFKEIQCKLLPIRFANIQTLAIINSTLSKIPLTFLTEFKHLKYLFLGGSNIFDRRLKHLLFDINSIFNVLNGVEQQVIKMISNRDENENDDDDINKDIELMNISEIKNNDPLSAECKTAALIELLMSLFSIINKLHLNGIQLIELTFCKPNNITLNKLSKYKEENYNNIHFDGLSIARLIFLHLINKYYASNIDILDLSIYPLIKYGNLYNLCDKYNNLMTTIQYVIDLETNEFGQTVLHTNCMNGNTIYVQELLFHGVYCDYRDRRGATPLFLASVNNYFEIVNLLIRSGADIFKRKTTKETPMEIACMRSHVETIKIMLESESVDKFNDNMKYDNQWSPIHCCCISGNMKILNLLIQNGLNYSAQNIWKQTPLHICAIKNYIKCAQILINKYNRKQLLLKDEFNKTAERIAKENNNYGIVNLIKSKIKQLNISQNTNYNNNYYNNYNHNNQHVYRNDNRNYNYNYNYYTDQNNNYNNNNNQNQYSDHDRYYRNRNRNRGRGRGNRARSRGYYYRPKQK